MTFTKEDKVQLQETAGQIKGTHMVARIIDGGE